MAKKTQKQPKRNVKEVRAGAVAATRRSYEKVFESDGTYFLKLVVFTLLGTFWVRFGQPVEWLGIPLTALPIGLIIGLMLVRRFEKHQSDRKIWYAILVVVTIACAYAPTGIVF
jgi:hypothetical protein